MQSFIVLASLIFELAGVGGGGGSQNDPLSPLRYKKNTLVLYVTKKHLSPLRVKG